MNYPEASLPFPATSTGSSVLGAEINIILMPRSYQSCYFHAKLIMLGYHKFDGKSPINIGGNIKIRNGHILPRVTLCK